MVEKEIVDLFLNKKIVFKWSINNKTFESVGFLKKVSSTSIIIEFRNKLQVYSLASIITIREFEEKEVGKNDRRR